MKLCDLHTHSIYSDGTYTPKKIEADLEQLLPLAKENGLVGMESYYTEYDDATTAKAINLANRFGLKYSGGSDFHGDRKAQIQLGVGFGNLQIPYEWSQILRSAI